jgi:hypothetical protein
MVDLGVAIAWIAISAASAKGLSAFVRAAAMSDVEAEPVALTGDGVARHDGLSRAIDISPRLLRE